MYNALNAGDLDTQVVIQSRSETDDDGGGQAITWSDGPTVNASIASPNGAETILAQGLEAGISHVVRIRYRTGVTAKNRLTYGSRVFPIHAVIDVDERHEQLVLYCSEVAPT